MATVKEADTITIDRTSGKFNITASADENANVSISNLDLKKIETFADLHTVINLLTDTEEALQAVTDMYDGEFCEECVGPCYVQ